MMKKILAGRSNPKLAHIIAKALRLKYVETKVGKFQDEELRVRVGEPLAGDCALIVQSTSKPANDHLMELLLLADTARRAGAQHIVAVMPYFGYGRQDRQCYDYGPVSASLVAMLLEAAGVERVITIDLHSRQIEGFFRIGVNNISSLALFLTKLRDYEDLVIVSPDAGGLMRAREFSQALGCDIAVIDKLRPRANESVARSIIGEVRGKNCVIIDDIVDTGSTLSNAAELVKNKGAKSVSAFITHAVLSEGSKEQLENSCLERIYVSDTIVHEGLPEKFYVISVAEVLALHIKNLV